VLAQHGDGLVERARLGICERRRFHGKSSPRVFFYCD
jgi:hypothetical protein